MQLTIHIATRPNAELQETATIALTGSLDSSTAPHLEEQLKPLLESVAELIFDLAQLDFITSAGLRVFAAARKRMRERHGQVSFVNLQPQIEKVFEIVAALPGMQVFRDTRELDSYLARRQQEARVKNPLDVNL